MKSDAVIDKVRKLLALARGASGHEAKSAAAMARDLMDHHGIDEDSVVDEEVVDVVAEERVDFNRERLAHVVARSRTCVAGTRTDTRGDRRIVVRGRARYAENAASVYRALVAVVTDKANLRDAPEPVLAVYRRVFWVAFVDAVARRLGPPPPPVVTATSEERFSYRSGGDAPRGDTTSHAVSEDDPFGDQFVDPPTPRGSKKKFLDGDVERERWALDEDRERALDTLREFGSPHALAERLESRAVAAAEYLAASVAIEEVGSHREARGVLKGREAVPRWVSDLEGEDDV